MEMWKVVILNLIAHFALMQMILVTHYWMYEHVSVLYWSLHLIVDTSHPY